MYKKVTPPRNNLYCPHGPAGAGTCARYTSLTPVSVTASDGFGLPRISRYEQQHLRSQLPVATHLMCLLYPPRTALNQCLPSLTSAGCVSQDEGRQTSADRRAPARALAADTASTAPSPTERDWPFPSHRPTAGLLGSATRHVT